MTRSSVLVALAASSHICASKRSQVDHGQMDFGIQPALRSDLTACPCTIWRHCTFSDILPEGEEPGVACVASEDAIVSFHHQVQCVPVRNGGLNYWCPPILPHKCDPGKQCIETDLAHCGDVDCETPAWLLKERTPTFCALTECTHAECCDRGPTLVTAAPNSATPPQDLSCRAKTKALAEPTLERLVAYTTECNFRSSDVDLGAGDLQLTKSGESKLWDEHCQGVLALQDSPDDVYADAQALLVECPNLRLKAQMNPVGVFGTTGALDRVWRSAPGRPPRQPRQPVEAELPPVPIEILPPAPTITVTTTPPTTPTTAAPDSCIGTVSFTLSLGEVDQTFTLGNAPEGKLERLQCDAGPYQFGTVDMRCQDGSWVMTNTGNACHDTEEGAAQMVGPGITGGTIPKIGNVLQVVDVTAVLTRLQSHSDSTVRCCCNARLDANLRANSWERSWNRREHTGICTVYENANSCVRTDSETHSHWRMEGGGRCIVNQEDRLEWERILQLGQSKPSSRFVKPDVPTVSEGQTTEHYRSCVTEHSLGECERCTHTMQCAKGWICCPYLKLCMQVQQGEGETECPSRMSAGCRNCYERWRPNPEKCEANCQNPSFPRTWLPSCESSSWWR